MLVGGLQDRVSIASHLLIPGDDVVIEVRCVEPERWAGDNRQVAGTRRATAYVRGETDQHGVWRRVAVERSRDRRRPDVTDLRPLPGQTVVLIALSGAAPFLPAVPRRHLLVNCNGMYARTRPAGTARSTRPAPPGMGRMPALSRLPAVP